MMDLKSLFPQSLIARLVLLYATTQLFFFGAGVALFYQYQFVQAMEEAQQAASMLIEVTAQTVSDSAVIGDYDTIKRMLNKSAQSSWFASVSYLDLGGGTMSSAGNARSHFYAPQWLQETVARTLYDINRTISVGGRDYGVLRLSFDLNKIAGNLWKLTLEALALSMFSLSVSMVLIWFSLKRWLGTLDRLGLYEGETHQDVDTAPAPLNTDVPIEFRPTFAILNRTTTSLRHELAARKKAVVSLRGVVDGLAPLDNPVTAASEQDIATLSDRIARLVQEREVVRIDLEHARDAAEAASRAKSRFLATMSHEIRTPMNSLLGMAQVLLRPNVAESDRLHYAETILSSGQTLLALLNDILDLSKIEAGRVELELLPLEPAQVIGEVRALFAEIAGAKGLRLECYSSVAPGSFLSDPHRLRQMLSNLVSNAVKFTDQGQIRIEVREVGDSTAPVPLADGHVGSLEFSVLDSGIGIASDQHNLLFLPFSQTDSSITRNYGGSGLGLSIVSSYAAMMGGEVGVDSTLGRGSCFWFRIPAARVAIDSHASVSDDSANEAPAPVADKPADAPRIAALVNDLLPLLAQRKYAAINRFRTLHEATAGTVLAAEINEAARLMDGFHFAALHDRLQRLAATHQWEIDK